MPFALDLAQGQNLEHFTQWIAEQNGCLVKRHPEGAYKLWDLKIINTKNTYFWECKFDKKSEETGNIAIEVMCYGKPSGLRATQATHWIICYFDKHDTKKWCIGAFPVKRLWTLMEKHGVKKEGGDYDASEMFVIPQHLIKEDREKYNKNWLIRLQEWKQYGKITSNTKGL